jgi:hypothetical protein
VPKDVSLEARQLVQRGLEHFERGRLQEAVSDWEVALRLEPGNVQAKRLVAFGQTRVRELETSMHDPHPRHDTLESPIPQFLAALTERRSEEVNLPLSDAATPRHELSDADTRRMSEASSDHAGVVAERTPDTLENFPVHVEDVRASATELIGECRTALNQQRNDAASLAAELTLQLAERAPPPGVDDVVDPSRALFERAFRACVGNVHGYPIRAVPAELLPDHGLDHRAAFVMSRMDGVMTLADLIDSSGMSRFDAFRLLASLRRSKVIDVVPG